MSNNIDLFAQATQVALRLHAAGRPGLLDKKDFYALLKFERLEWKIYTNSMGETRVLSPYGDTIKIDREDANITIRGPQKEIL